MVTGIASKFIAPKLLLCSVIIAFLCCCLLGSLCRRENLYPDFKRFHIYLSPISYYYPTSGQLLNLAEQKDQEKILVIVGGDSVLNCASLPVSKLWTGLLERELGEKYCVLNFSFQGGEPFEGGYWAAEALYKKGRKVIYLTDAQPGICGEPIGTLLAPLFFDFYCRDLLLHDTQRETYKERCLRDQCNLFDQSFSELERAGYLDRFTNARELWQTIGYKYFFTVWSNYAEPQFWRARSTYRDFAIARHWPYPDFVMQELEAVRERLKLVAPSGKTFVAEPKAWSAFDRRVKFIIPEAMRSRSLVVLPKYNPDLLRLLKPVEFAADDATYDEASSRWRRAGIKPVIVGRDYKISDYVDANHFSQSGSEKLAGEMAAQIKELTRELEY